MYPSFFIQPVDHALIVLSSSPVPSRLLGWADVVSYTSLQVKGEYKGQAAHNQRLIEEFMTDYLHPEDKEMGMKLMNNWLEDEGLGELFVSILSFAWQPYQATEMMIEAHMGLNYCLTH